jgi:DNA-binding NarL/FixJ family response regulator
MTQSSNGLTPLEKHASRPIEVLIFDPDPVSRHVLSCSLSESAGIQVVASVDDVSAFERGERAPGDVAVISVSQANGVEVARLFTELGLRVLCLGVDWTRERVIELFDVGMFGCLVKEINVGRLLAAVRAVASGCVVLSDELRNLRSNTFDLSPLPIPAASLAAGPRPSERLLETLTNREFEVLGLLAQGWSTAEMAAGLRVSKATVKSHVSHTLTKLGVRNRVEAVLLVRRLLDRGNTPLVAC